MSHLCYEFARWSASQAYQKDQSIVSPALDILKTKTPFSIWSGLGEGASSRYHLWAVVGWDKSDSHKAFAKDPSHDTMLDLFSVSFGNPSAPGEAIDYAHFNVDPAPAFNAPATSIIFLTPKGGISGEQAQAILERRYKYLLAHDKSNGAAWATVEENPKKFLLVEGWASADDLRKDSAQELEDNFDLERTVAGLATVQ